MHRDTPLLGRCLLPRQGQHELHHILHLHARVGRAGRGGERGADRGQQRGGHRPTRGGEVDGELLLEDGLRTGAWREGEEG